MATTKLDQFQEMEWFAGRVRDRRYVFSEHAVRALMSDQQPTWDNSLRRTPTLENETGETYTTCYFCGGAMKQISVGNFDYRLEGQLCVIKKVPASLYLECEEKYIDIEVEHRMNALIVAQDFTASEQAGVIEYP